MNRTTIEELRAKITEADVRFVVPEETKGALCKGCGSMVYFVQQPSGRLMPIDVFVSGGQVPHVGRARRPDDVFGRVFAEGAGRDGLGVSHLATCPAAADFRRRS